MGFILPHHRAWHSCSFPLGAFLTLASFLSIPICPCPRRESEGIAVSSFIFVSVIDCTIHLMGLFAPDVLVIPVLFPPSRRSTLSRWCASCILSGYYTFSYTLCVLYFARIFVPFALCLVLPELSLLLLPLCFLLLPPSFFLDQSLHCFLSLPLNGFFPLFRDYLPLPIGFPAAMPGFTQPLLGCLSVSLGFLSLLLDHPPPVLFDCQPLVLIQCHLPGLRTLRLLP
jgi:hypothetical protein